MNALEGQIGVVTGASSGIGKAIALGLAAQGVALGVVGRNLEALESVAEAARAAGAYVQCYHADFMKEGDISELASRLRHDFVHVDILIHSAGVHALGRIATAPVVEFDWQYRVNVRAPYALTQALLPMLRPFRGQIVFVNSGVGLSARANVGQYAATKHALKALADSLRDEVNAEGMRVLSVYLGRTDSPMQRAIHEMEGRAYHSERLLRPEDVAAVVINALNLERTAEVTDISIRPLRKLE